MINEELNTALYERQEDEIMTEKKQSKAAQWILESLTYKRAYAAIDRPDGRTMVHSLRYRGLI